ncbi:hypothetical protein ABBQ32_003963 [Trebouxia sp. C0010 RCD-2024]
MKAKVPAATTIRHIAQVASHTPARLFPLLGKRKRPLSGLPAQAAYAKHAKLLAISAKVANPESKAVEPPEKLVKYFQAGPVNKRRQGFFTKPTERQIKQAQETSQQSADQAGGNAATAAKAKSAEAADKGSAGNVFRNVIHELRDRNLPVEMHFAHTEDQYWIPVVRIPAKESRRKLVMHLGMFDDLWSAASLVPFAREDGLDVFLIGNRNCPPFVRDTDAAGEYFDYSIDELGLQDIKAADVLVNHIVTQELADMSTGNDCKQAFEHIKLVHSMAGAAVMIYLTDCLIKGEAHGISQIIAAGPAGFQRPKGLLGAGSQILRLLLRIPPHWQTITAFPIGLTEETLISEPIFKALYDVTSLKPLDKVAALALRTLLAGDTSKWADAIRREHYNPAGMPVVTWKILLHLLQQIKSRKFARFDYGKDKNQEVYRDDEPLDVAAVYDLLDVRIDFVAGARDSIVSPKAVQKHVDAILKANERRAARGDAPIGWTYEVLPELGHLDIIDGDNDVAVACLRKHWQREYL